MRQHVDADLAQQELDERSGGDSGGSLPRAGPFQHVAGVGEPVLLHPGEIGVTGAHLGERLLGDPRRRGHLGVPLVAAEPLGVPDLDRDRRAECAPVADPTEERELVGLETLARASSVPEAAAGELGLDVFDRHLQAGGEPLDDHDQPLAVGLTGGEEAQHRRHATPRRRMSSASPAARMTSGSGRRPVQSSCWRTAW